MNDLRDSVLAVDGIDSAVTENSDQNERPSRKRKEKKAPLVWTVDLHRKFVAAVNQLGIDKAVPKKILDLMNDEILTREDVTSHLVKYRLYLKMISKRENQNNPSGSFTSGGSMTHSKLPYSYKPKVTISCTNNALIIEWNPQEKQ